MTSDVDYFKLLLLSDYQYLELLNFNYASVFGTDLYLSDVYI